MRNWRRSTRVFIIAVTVATVIAAAIIAQVESHHGGKAAPTPATVTHPTR